MSSAAAASRPLRFLALTETERNWLLALLITLLCLLAFWTVGLIERIARDVERPERMIRNATEASTRFLAIAHTIVATLFLASSRRMRASGGWIWFAALAMGGAVLCLGYGWVEKRDSVLAGMLFYGYFIAHDFRDEVFLYRANGDAPSDPALARRGLWIAPVLAVLAIAAVFVPAAAFGIGGARRYDLFFEGMSMPVLWLLGLLMIPAAAWLFFVIRRRCEREFEGGWRGLLRAHRPLFFVFAGIDLVLLIGLAVTGRMWMIIALHVVVWYVFALRQIAKRSRDRPPARTMTWDWMRSTSRGFNVLHLGVLCVVVAAAAVWSFAFRNSPDLPVLPVLISRDSLPHWTILHVTLSWTPRGSAG